jgi:ribonucleoside-diphosphate reductase beta chain
MSNLLNRDTKIPVFKESTGTKYQFMDNYTEALMNMFWKFDSVPLGKDVEDYKKADQREKEFIKQIMLLFTGNEVLVSSGYSKMEEIFKPTEVLNWCIYANSTEVTHEKAYSLFTETIGLPDSIYTEFLDIQLMRTKTNYIDMARIKNPTIIESIIGKYIAPKKYDIKYRKNIARMIAVFGGLTENVSLFAQFAMLLAYQFENKYSGLCTIVEYSIKDEALHHKANAHLFREYIKENNDIWDDELKFEIYEATREVVAYEESLIDYLKPPHLDINDCKNYVRYQADNALKELGMKANYGIDKNPFPFMEEVTGTVLTDFFSGKVTSYSRKMVGSRDDLRNKLQSLKENND